MSIRTSRKMPPLSATVGDQCTDFFNVSFSCVGDDHEIWARAFAEERPPHIFPCLLGTCLLVGRFPPTPGVTDSMESPEMISFDEDGRDFDSKV